MVHAGRFGKYEIVRKLSRSMTDVYLAREPADLLTGQAGRQIVLKLIEESGDDFTRVAIEAEKRGAQLQRQLHTLDREFSRFTILGNSIKIFCRARIF